MKVKKIKYSLSILLVFICFGIVTGQNKTKSVGNITFEIDSKYDSPPKLFFDVPVNEKFPILQGDGLRWEESHSEKVRQLSSIAVADKNNAERALLKVTFMVSEKRGNIKIIKKKLKLLRGQRKNFRLKYKDFLYEITAFYEPVNK